jgi:hypothetical protein
MSAFELRPEARPVGWGSLTTSQKSALNSIVKCLESAIRSLPTAATNPAKLPVPSGRLGLDERRSNNTIMLSGARGTGKTSLFLTLRELLTPSLTDEQRLAKTAGTDFAAALTKLSKRIVWLETLDLEPLPHRSSLLSAIMARIEAAVHEENGNWPSFDLLNLSESRNGLEEAIFEFERLANDVAIAWEDGPEMTLAPIAELEIHARDARTAERARLSLRPRFDRIMELFSANVQWKHNVHDPIFILPVDDLDLNPRRCLELLRILRGLSTNRLFPLVLGDVNIARLVLELRMQAELIAVQKGARLSRDQSDELQRESRSLAAEAIRKLLPPQQRLYLTPLTLDEAMEFKPPFHETIASNREILRLQEIMQSVRLEVPASRNTDATDVRTATLYELVVGPSSKIWPRGRSPYSGILAFQGTVRELTDRWAALDQIADQSPKVSSRMISQHFWRELFAKLMSVERLPDSWRQELKSEEIDDLRRFPPFATRTNIRVSLFQRQDFLYPDVICETFNFDRVAVSDQFQSSERSTTVIESLKEFELEEKTSCSFMLFYDLLQCTFSEIEIRPILSSEYDTILIRLNRRLLDEVLGVAWKTPAFQTFRDMEWFGSWWNELLSRIAVASDLEYSRLGLLATYWMSASLAVMTKNGDDLERTSRFVHESNEIEIADKKIEGEVSEILRRFGELNANTDRYSRNMSGQAAIFMAILLSPEYAVPDSIARMFVQDEDHPLASLWRKHAKAIQQARLRVRSRTNDFLSHLLLNPKSFDDRCMRIFEQAANLVQRSEDFSSIKQLVADSRGKPALNLADLREALQKLGSSFKQRFEVKKRSINPFKRDIETSLETLRGVISVLERFETPDRQRSMYRQPEISDTLQLLNFIHNFCRKLQDSYQVNLDSSKHPINTFAGGILCPVITYDEPLA